MPARRPSAPGLLVSLLLTAAPPLLASGSAAAAAPAGAARNAPVRVPTGLTMTSPRVPCAGSGDPATWPSIKGANPPRLTVTVRDADASEGQPISADVELSQWDPKAARYAVKRVVTARGAAPEGDRSEASWNVAAAYDTLPEGIWRWRARGRDPFAVSAWTGYCNLVVDSTPPTVAPVIVPKGSNTYRLDDLQSWTFTPGRALGVTAFEVEVDGGPWRRIPAGGSLTTFFTRPGPHVLLARSLDAAGNPGPDARFVGRGRVNDFLVGGSFDPVARWRLDEGSPAKSAGASRPATDDPAGPWTALPGERLTFAGGTSWGQGRRSPFDPDEHVLVFDGVDDEASTSGPTGAVPVSGSFSVGAWVRFPAAALIGRRTVLTQDNGIGTGAGGGARWALSVDARDATVDGSPMRSYRPVVTARTASGATVTAVSPTPVQPDTWAYLLFGYRASTRELSLYVSSDGWNPSAVSVSLASGHGLQRAHGRLRLGRPRAPSAAARFFAGEVDELEVVAAGPSDVLAAIRASDPR